MTTEIRPINLIGPEYALHPAPVDRRWERALPPGLHHVYCPNPDCRGMTRAGTAVYVGALAPGGWAQCRKCGTWVE